MFSQDVFIGNISFLFLTRQLFPFLDSRTTLLQYFYNMVNIMIETYSVTDAQIIFSLSLIEALVHILLCCYIITSHYLVTCFCILSRLLISGKSHHWAALSELSLLQKQVWKAVPVTDCVMNCCLSKSHTNYTQTVLAQIEWKDAAQIGPVLFFFFFMCMNLAHGLLSLTYTRHVHTLLSALVFLSHTHIHTTIHRLHISPLSTGSTNLPYYCIVRHSAALNLLAHDGPTRWQVAGILIRPNA